MSEECIFCKIVKGEIPAYKVYEDEHTLAFLDIRPITPGHTLVIPKKHAQYITELDDETMSKLALAVKKVNEILRSSEIKCKDVSIHIADGVAAGQEIPHVHVHLIPRFEGDGFGLKFPENYGKTTKEEIEEIYSKIKKP